MISCNQSRSTQAKLERAIKTLGENYVLHPEYDAVKNRHHSVFEPPFVLNNRFISTQVSDSVQKPSVFQNTFLLFFNIEEIIAMQLADSYFASFMREAKDSDCDSIAKISDSVGKKIRKVCSQLEKK